jgi:YidC/Oxa1 family membrane protein insertase
VKAIPYLLLIVFLVGSSFYQQKQITARRSPTADGEENPVLQQQQAILKFLPFLTGVWSFFFPTGLSVYWATSNTFRIGQQAYITRTIYAKKDDMEASFQARLDERKKDQPTVAKKTSPIADETETSTADNNSASKVEQRRQKELQRQKAIRARAKAKAKATSDTSESGANSTRVTPKGTKPQQRKKKR